MLPMSVSGNVTLVSYYTGGGSFYNCFIRGRSPCSMSILNEETSLPYVFDVLDYHSITNKELQAHIDRVGKSIYLQSE